MRDQVQIGLRLSAVFFLLWALGMAAEPLTVHKLFSIGPYDPVSQAMLAASFLGFAIVLLVGSNDPRDDMTGAMAAMMLTIGTVGGINMAASQAMPSNALTVLSLIFVLGMGIYLMMGHLQEMFASSGGSSRRARPAAKKKPAKKAKKKVAKKKAKKKAVKKKRR